MILVFRMVTMDQLVNMLPSSPTPPGLSAMNTSSTRESHQWQGVLTASAWPFQQTWILHHVHHPDSSGINSRLWLKKMIMSLLWWILLCIVSLTDLIWFWDAPATTSLKLFLISFKGLAMTSFTGIFLLNSLETRWRIEATILIWSIFYVVIIVRRISWVYIELCSQAWCYWSIWWRSCGWNISNYQNNIGLVWWSWLQGNDVIFVHHSEPVSVTEAGARFKVLLHESKWERLDMPDKTASREYLMIALSNINYIIVKAAHSERTTTAGWVETKPCSCTGWILKDVFGDLFLVPLELS